MSLCHPVKKLVGFKNQDSCLLKSLWLLQKKKSDAAGTTDFHLTGFVPCQPGRNLPDIWSIVINELLPDNTMQIIHCFARYPELNNKIPAGQHRVIKKKPEL
jgi:hypothetical protein